MLAVDPSGKPLLNFFQVTPPPKQVRITVDGLAPYQRTEKPLVDDQGRVRVIVDFMDSAKEPFLDAARGAMDRFVPGLDRHHPQALFMLDAKFKQYDIQPEYRRNERGEQERTNITTWVGASLAAYLNAAQIDALRKDEDVRLVTEDHPIGLSAPPPWAQTSSGGEVNDWGWNAVSGKSVETVKPAGSNRIVWIVDTGVADHLDLPSVISRYNVDGGPTVGCYAHSTHVAGIIGATSGNGFGRRGVYAGVKMRSVNAGGGSGCANFGNVPYTGVNNPSAYALGQALDHVYNNSIVYWTNPGPNVVNLSMNPKTETGFSSSGVALSNQPKIAKLAQPAFPFPDFFRYYPGNVVVQSAGNIAQDACNNSPLLPPNGTQQDGTFIYKPYASSTTTDPADGILVVGALNSSGQPANPLSHPPTNVAGSATDDPGSNYGNCIDIWAPGDLIYSTWGASPTTLQGTQYSAYGYLSGTSMAAPHVAAAAAYYIDKLGLSTPAQVEQTLRSTANTALPSGLNMVQLQ